MNVCADCGSTATNSNPLVFAVRAGVQARICKDRGGCIERRQAAGQRVAKAMRAAGFATLPGMEAR